MAPNKEKSVMETILKDLEDFELNDFEIPDEITSNEK
jgi:hypothetical protein